MFTENDYTNGIGVIELSDGYIINGHHYDRNFKYTGKNYRFSYNGLCLFTSTNCDSVGNIYGNEMQQSSFTYNNITFFVINKKNIYTYDNNTYELTLFATVTFDINKIIKVDSNYIYIIRRDANGLNSYFSKINKSSKANTDISYDITDATGPYYYNSWGRNIVRAIEHIYNDGTNFYFTVFNGFTIGNYTWTEISRFDTLHSFNFTTQTETQIKQLRRHVYTLQQGSISHWSGRNFALLTDSKYVLYGRRKQAPLQICFTNIDDITIEKNTNIIVDTEAPIIYWNVEKNIFLVLYNEGTNSDVSKFYEYDFETEELKIVFDDKNHIIKRVLLSEDKKIVMLCGIGFSYIYTYSDDLYTYQKTGEIKNIKQIGIDSYDRIWYINNNNEIHCEDPNDPALSNLRFEKPLYTYIGQNINTYFDFDAKNTLDAHAFGYYTFELSDNAYFNENNSTELTVNYNQINQRFYFTIHDIGKVSCHVKFHKTWRK